MQSQIDKLLSQVTCKTKAGVACELVIWVLSEVRQMDLWRMLSSQPNLLDQ